MDSWSAKRKNTEIVEDINKDHGEKKLSWLLLDFQILVSVFPNDLLYSRPLFH